MSDNGQAEADPAEAGFVEVAASEPENEPDKTGKQAIVPFRLATRQFVVGVVAMVGGFWLWPGDVVGWQARVAALLWLVASLALVAACFWVVVGLVDGQWNESGFRPRSWLTGNKKRR